ncbi:nitroreductase [Rhodococcus sp. ACPA4]|jgi:nitroreductase|uniref:nitroreductase n=1 Tax=Rhodococcus TaxID=1827 RepID=UPI000BB0EC1D|nr:MULTISPECIES: nitroreductase [Rhodococcus]MCE4264772.1 nitroreductase [Rhodococcus globerulus]NRI68931.1 nitroreductase [Rhodococcus sp. MS16]PBC37891.1 nitroreductase [Rhodococcus sp. ACPA4]RZL27085.1 MAG: nitroreductase [Rhodococcus sp. (in: high G+C Gram-positive bacteria)]
MTENTATLSSLESLLDSRISCRAYEDRQVPRDVINEILRLAQKTPSWCNTQPWQVAITEGEGTEKFRAGLGAYVMANPQESDFEFPREYQGVYKSRRFDCAMALYSSVGIEHGDRAGSGAQTMKNFELFGAPHVAIITTDEALGTYGAVDCGLYVNSFLLAAQSLGVATIPQAALAGCSKFIHEHFGIDDTRNVVCAISFGYADTEHPVNGFRTAREDVDNVVQWMSN